MIVVHTNASGLLGPVRNQGQRGTCLAFTASDLNSVSNSTGHLSVEYLCHHAAQAIQDWTPEDGFSVDAVFSAVKASGQPSEDLCLYDGTNPAAPLTAPDSTLRPLYSSASQRRGMSAEEVVAEVRQGHPVGVVVAVTTTLFKPVDGIVTFDTMVLPNQYHAMVAVGVGRHSMTMETHVLLRNSWGALWGVDGHAWISHSYLAMHLVEGLVLSDGKTL